MGSGKRFSATLTIGGALAGSLHSALGTVQGKVLKVGDAIKQLEAEQQKLLKSFRSADGSKNVGDILAKYEKITKELQKQRAIVSAKQGMEAGKDRMGAAALGLGVVGAAAGVAVFPIVQAAKFESAMLGVAKQVDGARDASGKLTSVYFDMKAQIQALGREMPMATTSIAEMVAAGARMGIAREELVEFTRTAGMMAEAFELPAGELADQMGQIRTLFGLKTQKEVRSLADVINYLDDNAISKGSDIIDFLQRTGGVAGSVKVTGQQMAALGSTLLTLGTKTQVAGTAVNAIFQKLGAAEKGTKKFKGAMAQLGLSTTAVQKGMQKDAQGTLLNVLDHIKALPEDKRLGVMVDLVGLEHSDELAKLATGVGEYRKQIELSNNKAADGSMQREFNARLSTTAAQFELAKNRAAELAEKIGAVFLPVVNEALPKIGDIITKTADWIGDNKELIGNIGLLAGGLTAGYAAFQLVSGGIGAITFAFNALKLAMLAHPIFLAVTLLGTAALLIYKNWEPIKYFFTELWASISGGATAAFETVMAKMSWVGDAWRNFKATLGFGGGEAPSSAPLTPTAPEVPALAPGRGSGTVTTTNNNSITINQRPGQDSKALAREVAAEIANQNAVARRGSMLDPAGAY